MADGVKIVDEATTRALLQAFQQAKQDQQTAHSAVSGTAASLAGGWTGQASGTYGNGLARWMSALTRVGNALHMLDGAMQTFAKDTQNTEEGNNALAGSALSSASWT